MGLECDYTCPEINGHIKDIKFSIKTWLLDNFENNIINRGLDLDVLVEDFYSQAINYDFEHIRNLNSNLRIQADRQIDDLNSEVESLKEDISNLKEDFENYKNQYSCDEYYE